MRGKIIGQAVQPLSQEYEITITLPLEDWQTFRNQIRKMDGNNSYPAWHVIQGIDDCITHARTHFEKQIKSE